MKISNAEKLILTMLCEMQEHLKTKGEIDPAFVKDAIYSNHLWAIEWKYHGLFEGSSEPNPPEVKFVTDVLDMWSFIEPAYKDLSTEDKKRVDAEVPFGLEGFEGFDGNNEIEYLSIARFLVEKMDLFSDFKGRVVNSHMPKVGRYEQMLSVFEPIRVTLGAPRRLNADELIKIGKR